MARSYCELELRLAWYSESSYMLDARFMNPLSDTENELVEPMRMTVDFSQLNDAVLEPQRYGQLLTELLFGASDSLVRVAYRHARVAAAKQDGLRIRLNIQSSAPELHGLRWETLLDPDDNTRLLVQEDIWFARFLSARDFRWQPPSTLSDMRALVVIANPADLEQRWGLAAIDTLAEFERVQQAIVDGGRNAATKIKVQLFDRAASVLNIADALKSHYADVLYIICHGAITQDGKPRLLLETEEHVSHLIEGRELVERLRDMGERPRLIVLASCASAGDGHQGALTAIGPSLAAAGVPAVIAMQGAITQYSSSLFMSKLFEELARSGQIDQAVACARSQIRNEEDWWMPVLFMRLKTGRLWPAFAQPDSQFDKWKSIVTDLESGQCVPILGPSLVESTLGSVRSIAKKWAELYEFPLAPQYRDSLAHVAQYLSYRQSNNVVFSELQSYLITYLRSMYREELSSVEGDAGQLMRAGGNSTRTLNALMEHIGRLQRRRDKNDVHRLLAKLPAAVYINANRDNLLRDALCEAGRTPRVALCTWLVSNGRPRMVGPSLPEDYVPSLEEPLVFHVFGNLEYNNSLVITEDNYFDFLMAVTRNESSHSACIPGVVNNALVSSGLLLLGFQPDDWDFRVLLKGVLNQPGSSLNSNCVRVAVQMNLTEGLIIDPDRASEYLRTYFGNSKQGELLTFWGSAQSFIEVLVDRCIEQGLISPEP